MQPHHSLIVSYLVVSTADVVGRDRDAYLSFTARC